MSNKNDDFVSFEKALRDLKLRSEELKKLVSEGEIRAYRDGDSMKFRMEDVEALVSKAQGESELSFADSLEDDTGMVTEQLSDEDTLLAEEDDEIVERKSSRRAAAPRAARAAAPVAAASAKEPGWVTAVAILGFAVMLFGFYLTHAITHEVSPSEGFLTSFWADK